MRLHVFTNFLGSFVFDEKEKLQEFRLFGNDPKKIAEILLKNNKIPKELRQKYPNLREADKINFNFLEFALKEKIFRTEREYFLFLQKVAQNFTSQKIKESLSEDLFLIELIKLYQDLTKTINSLKERLTSLKNVKSTSYLGKKLEFKTKELKEYQEEVEKQVSELSNEIMPNTSYILGADLAAQLLSLAGSLEKLAIMPSSTIQVLGAEKALFRHLKEQGKAPKHGILFLYPKINSIKKEKRGAMARFVANKLSILTKVDFYNGEFIADQIEKQIEEKYKSLTT